MSNLAKNYLYNILGLLTGTLFPFITFPYISRVLMPEYLGKITFTQSLANYFITLALLGIPAYGIRELSRARISSDKKEFSKKFTELLLISLFSSLISFLAFMLIITFSKKLIDVKELLYIYSFQIVFAFLNLDYVFIALERHKRRTIRTVILRVISLVLILTLVKKPEDYIIYGVILVIPELLARVIDIYLCKMYIYKKISSLEFKIHTKPLFTIFLYVFSVGIYINLDATMLGFMKTETEVGLYSTGSKLVKMVVPIMGVLGTVMAPRIIGYIKKKDKEKIYSTMDSFIDFNIFLGVPAT
ncbi:MAG: oligosaccharide flippase family protein, partial [Fusobacteriaceae bacterium]